MPPGSPPPSLKARALRLLAAREYTRAQLHARLARRLTEEEGEADITAALDALERAGLISEERAAESLLRRRAPRLGAARVLRELREQGTPEALVEHAAAELRASEVARARAVWQRKFGQPPQSAAERARQLRFLAARGFSFDTARRVIGSAAEDAEDAGWQP